MNVSACTDRESDRAVMALTVGDVWLSLPDNFVEVQPGIFARRDYTTNFLDVTPTWAQRGGIQDDTAAETHRLASDRGQQPCGKS